MPPRSMKLELYGNTPVKVRTACKDILTDVQVVLADGVPYSVQNEEQNIVKYVQFLSTDTAPEVNSIAHSLGSNQVGNGDWAYFKLTPFIDLWFWFSGNPSERNILTVGDAS